MSEDRFISGLKGAAPFPKVINFRTGSNAEMEVNFNRCEGSTPAKRRYIRSLGIELSVRHNTNSVASSCEIQCEMRERGGRKYDFFFKNDRSSPSFGVRSLNENAS